MQYIRQQLYMRLGQHPVLIHLFAWFWTHRLRDDWTGKPCKVLCIKGLRTALIETPSGQRCTVQWL